MFISLASIILLQINLYIFNEKDIMRIYTYMNVYIYIYMYTCIHTHIHIRIRISTRIYQTPYTRTRYYNRIVLDIS